VLEQQKLRQQKQKQLELEKQQDKLRKEKLKAEKLKQELADKNQKDAIEMKKLALESKKIEAQRQTNLDRMAGLAGASGAPTASGTALKSSGPSASYAGRIRARIKPNIVFTETITGNPSATVEVRTAPDGTIVSRKLTQSSSIKAWDEAVLRAIDKTEVLPRDTDGRVPASLEISFKPKD
jgi:colicin import membrane protein